MLSSSAFISAWMLSRFCFAASRSLSIDFVLARDSFLLSWSSFFSSLSLALPIGFISDRNAFSSSFADCSASTSASASFFCCLRPFFLSVPSSFLSEAVIDLCSSPTD